MDGWKVLKQGEGQLTIYTEKYHQLVLQLPHLHPITKLHGFVSSLRPCIRMEVEKMNPQSCEEAMRVAERISDIEQIHARHIEINQLPSTIEVG